MALSDKQIAKLAREIWALDYEGGRALKYLSGTMREALAHHRLIQTLWGQDGASFSAESLYDHGLRLRESIRAKANNPGFFE